MANYIGELVRQTGISSLRIGVIQTAYANGASTDYINNIAVSSCKLRHQSVLLKSFYSIHSFIPDIHIMPLQVHYYSEALQARASILCRS